MNDSRIQTAIESVRAAIDAMQQARRDINELAAELANPPAQLAWVSVELGHSIRHAANIIRDLERVQGATV